jgi:hypothetical protein
MMDGYKGSRNAMLNAATRPQKSTRSSYSAFTALALPHRYTSLSPVHLTSQPYTAVAPVAIPNKAKSSNASSQAKSQRTPTNPQFPPYNSDALFLRRISC